MNNKKHDTRVQREFRAVPGSFYVRKRYLWFKRCVAFLLIGSMIGINNPTPAYAADVTAPSVLVSLPIHNAIVFGSKVLLSASAADDSGTLAGVQFLVDGANVGSEDVIRPYQLVWDSKTVSDGAHTVKAIARDPSNNRTTSAQITLTVNNQLAPKGIGLANEFWAQLGKDGHRRNSNAMPIQGNLKMSWARALRGFQIADPNNDASYQRSNNLSIRNGRIALIVPSVDPKAESIAWGGGMRFAAYGIYNLQDGSLINSTLTSIIGASGLLTGSRNGIMDSDLAGGVINQYWKADGTLYAAWGSDRAGSYELNPYTAEIPFGLPHSALAGGNSNSSGHFAMIDSDPLLWAGGGAGGHSPFESGGAGILGQTSRGLDALKLYSSFVLDGNWVYSINVTNAIPTLPSGGYGFGVRITGVEASTALPYSLTNRWTYTDANKGFLTFGQYHAGGGLRAFTAGEDGRLYYFGYYTTGVAAAQVPDFTRGVVLTGVPIAGVGNTRTADFEVNIPWNPLSDAAGNSSIESTLRLLPQIAMRDHYVVVFQPQQSVQNTNVNGHLFVIDTITKNVQRIDFPQNYFTTNTVPSYYSQRNGGLYGQLSPEKAVAMTIAGDSAYIVEPSLSNGTILQLRVERIVLSTGVRSTTTLTPVDESGRVIVPPFGSITVGQGTVAMRDLAPVDGKLVGLVDLDITDQALVVIEGDASPSSDFVPTAVISGPVTGTPTVKTFADDPRPPTNQFDTGVPIAFSSFGSLDPDGGNLTYLWDFGDGTTSNLANPTHIYQTQGRFLTVTNRNVKLIVTDNEGNVSAPAFTVLAVRDAGAIQHVNIQAEADSWVDLTTANLNQNHGADSTFAIGNKYLQMGLPNGPKRGYIRFDLGAINPSKVVSARLRLYIKSYNYAGPHTLQMHASSNNWSEATVNGANAPAPGNLIAEMNATYAANEFYYELPLTQYVKQTGVDKKVSIELNLFHPTPDIAWYQFFPSTKEGTEAPQLVLEVDDPALRVVDTTAPTAPEGLITNVTSSQINLSWNASADNVGVAGYMIYRNGVYLATSPSATYSNTNLLASTTYIYAVSAYDAAGNNSVQSAPISATTNAILDLTPPTVPSNLSAVPISTSQIALAWSASNDNAAVFGYKIFRNGVQIAATVSTSYSDTNLLAGTVYSYTVLAYDAFNNMSAQSRVVSATTYQPDVTAPSVPGNLKALVLSNSKISVSWSASTDNVEVAGYKLIRNGVEVLLTGPSPLVLGRTDSSLLPGTTYSYKVLAYDTSGNLSAQSAAVSATTNPPDVTAPTAPTLLTAGVVTDTQINFAWLRSTDNVGVTGYRVFRDGVLQIATLPFTNFTDSGLNPSTTYTYIVVAYDADGNTSAPSASLIVKTNASIVLMDVTAPSVPTNLAAAVVSDTQINLSWTASNDNVAVAGYTIYRNGAQIATSASASYSDTNLLPSTMYSYAVSAYDAVGNDSAQASSVSAKTNAPLDVTAPTVPANLSAAAVSSSQIALAWSVSADNVGVTGYKIFRDGINIATSVLASYSDINLLASTNYTYAVLAYDAAGNNSAKSVSMSAKTNAAPDVAAPTVPAGLAGAVISDTQINLSWNASADNVAVTGYKIFRNGAEITSTASTSYSDAGLSASTTYSYKVLAYDAAGNASAQSASVNGTTLAPILPSAPTGLLATASIGRIDLSWTAGVGSSAATGYYVYRNGTEIANTRATSYSDQNVVLGTPYSYNIVAYDARGKKSDPSVGSGIITLSKKANFNAPSVPSGLSATAISASRIDLSWGASLDDIQMGGYKIFRNGIQIAIAEATSYSDNGLSAATNYSYTVSAYDTSGNNSGMSNTASAKTKLPPDAAPPSVPAGLGATVISDTQINLNWNPSADNITVSGYKVFRNGSQITDTTSTSYSDTGLIQSTNYSYTVLAYDAAGNASAQSAVANARTRAFVDVASPSVPAGLAASVISDTRINLNWNASNDNVAVTGYKIFRNGSQITSTAATSYSDSGLSPSTNYSYTVLAYDAAGNISAQSAAVNAKTNPAPDVAAPTVPAGLGAAVISDTQINLSWNASADNVAVTGYKLFRNGALITSTAATSYSDVGLSQSTNYSYTVLAYDAVGNASAQSVAIIAKTKAFVDVTAPSVPAGLAASVISDTRIDLNWNASNDNVAVTGYKIFRNGSQITSTAATSYSDLGLSPSTNYSYTVLAYDAAGNASVQSAAVNAKTNAAPDVAAPSVPTNLSAAAVSPNQIDLSWNASADNVGVAGYKIFRNGSEITSTASTSYSDTGLSASTTYSYKVLAYDAAGNASAQSAGVNATTLAPAVPSAPTGLLATASIGRIDLSWSAGVGGSGAVGYYVYRNGTEIANTRATSYADQEVSLTTPYSYNIVAYDARGKLSSPSVGSGIITLSKKMNYNAPTVPSGLSATAVSPNRIDLAWNASSDDIQMGGYKIFRNGIQIAIAESTSYSDNRLSAATNYSYTVSAYDLSGNNSGMSSIASAKTKPPADALPPSIPSGLGAAVISTSQIDLNWNASVDNVAMGGYRIFRNGSQIADISSTSYSDTGLSESTNYSYSVLAYDAVGNASAQSAAVNARTKVFVDVAAPSVPTGLSGTAVSTSQIDLSWNVSIDNVAVTGYKIFRGGVLVASSAVANYSDRGLSASTNYSYTVLAYDAAGNASAQSAVVTAKTNAPPDLAAPTVPAGLTAAVISDSQINLAWNASADNVAVTGYKIFRNGTQITSTAATTYSDTGLIQSTNYSYTILAYDAAGNASAQSAAINARTKVFVDVAAPSVPTGLSGTAVSTSQIDLRWNVSIDNVAVTGYKIFRGGVLVASSAVANYSDKGLNASTNYSYTVLAYDAAGNASVQSAAVIAKTNAPPDVTAPSVPSGLAASIISDTQINLNWNASNDNVGVAGYRVFRNGWEIAVSEVPSFSDRGLSASTTYSYKVQAFDAAGNASGQSAAVNASTQAPAAPLAPTNLMATPASFSSINLSWNAPTGGSPAAGYYIYRDGIQVATTRGTSYTDTELLLYIPYLYTVVAYDARGNISRPSIDSGVIILNKKMKF